MDQQHDVELLDTVPFPVTLSRPGVGLGIIVFGPGRTKLYGTVLGQGGFTEVDVESLETRWIDIEFERSIRVNSMAIDGAHNCAIADTHNKALHFLDPEFRLIKRLSFAAGQLGTPLYVIGIQSGGFMAYIGSRNTSKVLKFNANGDEDWQREVFLNGEPAVGRIIPFYGIAENCFLLAETRDAANSQSNQVTVIRCEAGGCLESPVLFRLESPSAPSPGRPFSMSSEFVGSVMPVGVEGNCQLTYCNEKSRLPVLVRYMVGEEPRVYRLPCDVLELLPFDDDTFWGRPFGSMRSNTLAFRFRMPAWEAGLPFSEFIKGQGGDPGYGIADFPSNDKPNAPDSGSESTSHRVSQFPT